MLNVKKTFKCPHCKKESDCVLFVEITKQFWECYPSNDIEGDMNFDDKRDEETIDNEGYVCPICGKKVADEREDAYSLFNKKKVEK